MGCGSSTSDKDEVDSKEDTLSKDDKEAQTWATQRGNQAKYESKYETLPAADAELQGKIATLLKPSFIYRDKLYLSSVVVAGNVAQLHELGITHVLSVAPIFPQFPQNIKYQTVNIEDDETENMLAHLEACFAFLDEGIAEGNRALVHCKMGVSRSAAVCIAYLMREHDLTLEVALAQCKKRRPCIDPNDSFLTQLRLFGQMKCRVKAKNRSYQAMSRQLMKMKEHRNNTGDMNDEQFNVFATTQKCVDDVYERMVSYGGDVTEFYLKVYDKETVHNSVDTNDEDFLDLTPKHSTP